MKIRKPNTKTIYTPKALISGEAIEAGLDGLYAAVPDRGYKGHPFTIKFIYKKINEAGELAYFIIEKKIEDWNRADRFRRFMDKWGKGTYNLGYFKVAEKL